MKAAMLLMAAGMAAAPTKTQPPPKPTIQLVSLERYASGSRDWVRHTYKVLNKGSFPVEMFAAAPELPPCGLNTKASRSWIDVYSGDDKRLYGFCAIRKPDELDHIWFASELGASPPPSIYIVITDRKTGVEYKSNLEATSFDSSLPAARRP